MTERNIHSTFEELAQRLSTLEHLLAEFFECAGKRLEFPGRPSLFHKESPNICQRGIELRDLGYTMRDLAQKIREAMNERV